MTLDLHGRPYENISASKHVGMLARHYLSLRQKRARMFAPALFEDPAWDILLDLFAHRVSGHEVSVSSACMASGVAASTALRYLAKLEAHGFIVRHRDENDGRRIFLSLTDGTAHAMEKWLCTAFASENKLR